MRTLKQASLSTFRVDLWFLEATLLAEDLSDLAGPVSELIERANALIAQGAELQRVRTREQAQAGRADYRIDSGIEDFSRNALVETGDKRSDAYQHLFKGGASAMVRFALRTQLGVSKKLRERLVLSKLSDSFKDRWSKVLQDNEAAGLAWVEKLDAAELGLATWRLQVRDFKKDADNVRVATYGSLLGRAPSGEKPKEWAESFFRPADAGNAADSDEVSGEPETETTDTPS